MGKKVERSKKSKTGWANDEFDDFKRARDSDSDDGNYKPG